MTPFSINGSDFFDLTLRLTVQVIVFVVQWYKMTFRFRVASGRIETGKQAIMRVADEEPSLFTMGHSNHALKEFLALLGQHEIETLIDVRSLPVSSYSPHFNARPLREAIETAGIRYGFYGRELGGRPEDPALYDEAGYVLYGEVARTPLFQDGLARLEKGLQRCRVAIMCS